VAQNFFFMRKPPGLRLRFELSPEASAEFADVLYEQADSWRADGLIEAVRPGVYEPESVLFGGPESMRYVHALFTVDSLFWLNYHALATPDEPAEPTLVSLPMLRFLLDGLDVTGWEDLGVWNQVRTATGRQLPPAADLTGFADVAGGIRRLWYEQNSYMEQLDPARQALLAEHGELLRHGAQRWSSDYFASRSATIGPRAAAAYYVVFFWNRAGLSAIEQAIVAESLSVR
jgi:thiopeptide-type bacteriocin biosynthesis protein